MLSVNKYANESALSLVLGSQHNSTRTCCGAPASRSSCYRWISAAGAASSSSQPHVHAVCRRSTGQTDRQTEDGHLSVIYTLYSTHCGVGVNNHVVKNVFHAQRSSSSKSFNLSEKHQISSKSLTMQTWQLDIQIWTYICPKLR